MTRLTAFVCRLPKTAIHSSRPGTVMLTIVKRMGRYLERQGLLERNAEHSYLNANAIEDEQDPMHHLHGPSVTYRIVVGPRQPEFDLLAAVA